MSLSTEHAVAILGQTMNIFDNKMPEFRATRGFSARLIAASSAAALCSVLVGIGPVQTASAQSPAATSGRIVTGHSKQCLDVPNGDLGENIPIMQFTCDGTPQQAFAVIPAGNGYYSIKSGVSGKCLTTENRHTADNVAIVQHSCDRTASQLFSLAPVGKDFYNITALHSGRCISVPNGSMADNTVLTQVQCNGKQWQMFWFQDLVGMNVPQPTAAQQPPIPQPQIQQPPAQQPPARRPQWQPPQMQQPNPQQQWRQPQVRLPRVQQPGVQPQWRQPPVQNAQAAEIDAGIESPGNQVFLVRQDRGVMQYNTNSANPGTGPNDLSRTALGPYMSKLTASFSYGGVKYLFLRTGQFVGLDANTENVVQPLSYIDNNNWPGMAPHRSKIEAALRFKGNSILFFLNNGQYIEYDMALRNIVLGPIAMNAFTLPSLQNVAGDITAAARWDNNRAVIFLKGGRHMWFNFRGVNASGAPASNLGSQFAQPQAMSGGFQGPVGQPQLQQPPVRQPQWQLPPIIQQPPVQQPVGVGAPIRNLTNKLNFSANTLTLALSPDGQLLATGGWDNHLSIWNSNSQTMNLAVAIPLQAKGDLLLDIAFSPNSQRIVSGSRQSGNAPLSSVSVWDVATGAPALTLQNTYAGTCDSVAYDAQGLRIAAGCHNQATNNATLQIWDANTGAALNQINAVSGPVAFSPNGALVTALNKSAQQIEIFDAGNGQLLQTINVNTVGGIKQAVFTADSALLITGNFDGTVSVWKVATGQRLSTFAGHNSSVNDISFNQDISRIVSAHEDGLLILWDGTTGAALSSFQASKALRSVVLNADGKSVVTGGDENIVRVFAD